MLFFVSKSHNISIYELPTHLRARFREVGASLLVSPHYWVLTGMSTMPPSGRSKKLVPEFLEGIIHDQNVRHQPLSSPRSRMGNYAALVKAFSPSCIINSRQAPQGIPKLRSGIITTIFKISLSPCVIRFAIALRSAHIPKEHAVSMHTPQ